MNRSMCRRKKLLGFTVESKDRDRSGEQRVV